MAKNYTDQLAQVPLFAACSKKELQKIGRASDEIEIKAGRELTKQGTAGREAFIILDGAASVWINNQKVSELRPGAAIGEYSLLDRGPRTATVVADTDMSVLVLGPREFAGVLDEVPALAHKLLGAMAAKIRELDSQLYG